MGGAARKLLQTEILQDPPPKLLGTFMYKPHIKI